MEVILARLAAAPRFTFSSLFPGKISLRRLVATFLALLELTRLGRLALHQDEAFADIHCEAVAQKALETAAEPPTVTPPDETALPPPLRPS